MPKNEPRVGWCHITGKMSYISRKAARAGFKRLFPHEKGLNAFPCGDHWHFGHLKEGDR